LEAENLEILEELDFLIPPWRSNNIAVFALDLKSAYEGEYMIFGLLSLAKLAQDYVLQFYPFTCEW
jgi:hypothetical protein